MCVCDAGGYQEGPGNTGGGQSAIELWPTHQRMHRHRHARHRVRRVPDTIWEGGEIPEGGREYRRGFGGRSQPVHSAPAYPRASEPARPCPPQEGRGVPDTEGGGGMPSETGGGGERAYQPAFQLWPCHQ